MIQRSLIGLCILLGACFATVPDSTSSTDAPVTCSATWYQFAEETLGSGDGRGHGPDIASDEWKSVIEFKLGLRGSPDLPSRDSDAWCQDIDKLLQRRIKSMPDGGRERQDI